MAKAVDTYTWESYESELKAYLSVVGFEEDVLLKIWLDSASEDCDSFIGWYYTDSEGTLQDLTPDTHPTYIKLGIYEYIRALRERYQRTTAIGTLVVKTGALSESYGSSLDFSIGIKLARSVSYPIWEKSKVNLLLLGVI